MPITAAIVGLGLAQTGLGISQQIKGNKMAKENVRPDFEIPDEYFENVSLAESQAQEGISSEAKQALKQGAEQGFTASTGLALQTGQGLNTISGLFSDFVGSLSDLAIADSDRKDEKIRDLYGLKTDLGEMKVTEFLYDKDAKYKDTAQTAALLSEQGTKNFFGGTDQAIAGLAGNQMGNIYSDLLGGQKNAGAGSGAASGASAGILGGTSGTNAGLVTEADQIVAALKKLLSLDTD